MQGPMPKGELLDLAIIKPIADEFRFNDNVLALLLFGSVAKGHARSDSDIDLCIITKKGTTASECMNLRRYGSKRVDLSLFFALPLTIRFRVIKEGKILFCKDPLAIHRIKSDTIREYLDRAPLIRRHCLRAMNDSDAGVSS
jgi:predicted nucleotidyltransferase